eukprot:1931385-Rhodomonas_salina.1
MVPVPPDGEKLFASCTHHVSVRTRRGKGKRESLGRLDACTRMERGKRESLGHLRAWTRMERE